MRYFPNGYDILSCEFVENHPNNKGLIFVKLLEAGNGFPIGHIIAISKNDIII